MAYLPAASIVDVLFEQLAYLLAHNTDGNCITECPICTRLDHVSRTLMIPFNPHSS